MAYFCTALTAEPLSGRRADRVIQYGGNFAGVRSVEWYVPLTICKGWAKAEDPVKQVGTTVK
jgi:hypothetical protein